jgi:hypothetical protein
MRKTLVLSTALAALLLAGPAFAQTATGTDQMPMPNDGQPGMTAAGANSPDTGITPTPRHRHRRHANTDANNDNSGSMDQQAEGVRPGHEPGMGDSEPSSTRASNIDATDTTRSGIAPRLPDPLHARHGSADDYLQAAARALGGHRTGEAQEALERAETRLLDRAAMRGVSGQNDPAVQAVSEARRDLANGDMVGAREAVHSAMNALAMGGPGGNNAVNNPTGGGPTGGGMGQTPGQTLGTPGGGMNTGPGMTNMPGVNGAPAANGGAPMDRTGE